MSDFYEVLQVSPRAEPEVIRAAYRTLARKYHPDHGGDRARMVAINDAWDVLGDPARRAEYDATLAAAASSRAAPTSFTAAWAARAAQGQTQPAAAPAPPSVDPNHAGPPPGNPSGTVLDFGRYSGWSLGEIARMDPGYLEWLHRMTLGRHLRGEIDALLRRPGGARPAAGPFGRR